MTLLTTIADAANELGIPAPTSVVTATTNNLAVQLLAHATRTGKELRDQYDFPQLIKEYTFTLSTSTASYAMPADFERFAFMTHWDRTSAWELNGPMSAGDWQVLKSSGVTTSPNRNWRFKGVTTNQFFIDPTPTSADNGATMVFEYISKNWLRPRSWVTATSYAAGAYSFYNGNVYSTTAGGTSGATPPTHTSGSASDGTVTWIYVSLYENYLFDTDISHIDEQLITMGTKWRYQQAKQLPGWDLFKSEFDAACHRIANNNVGASSINLNANRINRTLGYPQVPLVFG